MKRGNPKREHGAALLALLAVIMLGASWFLVSQLNSESGGRTAVNQGRNAEVLNRARLSLIGYVAAQAAEAGETNPGRLPCPEPAGYIGGTNEGVAAGNCTLPAIGRFPWRTFGTDKLVDSAGESLWYVVSHAWALSNSTTPPLTTYINSNSNGQLLVNARSVSTLSQTAGLATAVSAAHGFRTGDIVKIAGAVPAGYNVAASVTVVNANTFTFAVDSALASSATGTIKAGDSAVALITAPSPAMNVAATTDCTARNQARSAPSPTINALDYLECYDAANGVFSATGPTGSFNDQVTIITAADVLPAIEAAIANRIEREIVPVLKAVYADATWGTSTTNPAFPFPAPFGDPTTSSYLGQAGLYQGLLPFNYHSSSCPVGDMRCSTDALTWDVPSLSTSGGPGYLPTAPSCYTSGSTPICEGYYYGGTLNITMADPVNGITKGLRTFSGSNSTGYYRAWQWTGTAWSYLGQQSTTGSRNLATTGALNLNSRAPLPSVPGWGYYYIYATSRPTSADFADHAILDSSNADTGWFVRNEWYRLLYYAIASGHAPGGSLSCTTGTDCLSVANVTPANAQRAILILTGRSINGTARPSSTLTNYLEFGNTTGTFERQPVSSAVDAGSKKPFNDRIVVVGSN